MCIADASLPSVHGDAGEKLDLVQVIGIAVGPDVRVVQLRPKGEARSEWELRAEADAGQGGGRAVVSGRRDELQRGEWAEIRLGLEAGAREVIEHTEPELQ